MLRGADKLHNILPVRSSSSKQMTDVETEKVSAACGTIRTSISMTPLIVKVAAILEAQGGFSSFSDYVTELVRRDAQRGITSYKLPRAQWQNPKKAA